MSTPANFNDIQIEASNLFTGAQNVEYYFTLTFNATHADDDLLIIAFPLNVEVPAIPTCYGIDD